MKVELTIELVTPLFLGGAEQQPELRPASVRGALRYWLRALLGGEVGDDLASLHKKESAVFGATDQASPVIVRVSGTPAVMHDFDLDRNKKWHQQQSQSGHDYLYFSTRLGDNRRIPFTPGVTPSLRLVLETRRAITAVQNPFRQAVASAWLLTHLGGLGMRSRRCGGSIQVANNGVNGDIEGLLTFPVAAEDIQTLRADITQGLNSVRALVSPADNPSRRYDVLHPAVSRVWVIAGESPWSTWKEAVDAIGAKMQIFRASQGNRHNEINSIFGIPIRHGPNYDLERRASPLWLRVTRLANGHYVGVATLFKADFNRGQHEVGGGYAHIEDFVINTLQGQEVIYA